jgi:hypothetical protein
MVTARILRKKGGYQLLAEINGSFPQDLSYQASTSRQKRLRFILRLADFIKIDLASFVQLVTARNNFCHVISVANKTGTDVKIATNKKGGHSWPPLVYTVHLACAPGTLPCIPGDIPALPVLAV